MKSRIRSLAVVGALALTACISPVEQQKANEKVRVFRTGDAIPSDYVAMGEVRTTKEYANLRPIEREVIDSLILRAYQGGYDAIGEIDIRRTSRDLLTQTPRAIILSGVATTYKKRPDS